MEIENLDHLGLVAALLDEMGLVELADELLEPHNLNHTSPGQVVKAMILNGLGFVSAPLYLFSEFFEGKPVEHLLGAGITAAHLNDDRLGRVLDQLFEYGTTVDNKGNKPWVWLAIDADTREIIGCHIGDRSRESAMALWQSIPAVYRQWAKVYTDY